MAGYVLIVDDDPECRDGLAQLLSDLGYTCETAQHGAEALDRIADKGLPGMVLLDLKMPVMSGWEVMKHLRGESRTREVPVLILSGYGFEWEAELMGAQGYVPKPIRLEQLKEAIARAMGVAPRRSGWMN